MIYYFSGTGNSAFVAFKLAEYTKDECRFIPDVPRAMQDGITAAAGDTIGVVCPIYAWGVPECVMDFLTHVKVDRQAFAYIVVTCGSDAGKAVRQVERVFPFNSAYSVRMPDNCTALFKTDSEELTREKINVARQLLPRIAQGITAHKSTYDVKEGYEGALKSCVINPLFSLFFMRTKRFKVSDDCTGCGKCADVCPFGLLEIADGRPHWKSDRCQMCMKCVMHCPTRALRLGASARHDVYLFPEELMKHGGVTGSVVHERAAATSLVKDAETAHSGSVNDIETLATFSPAMMPNREIDKVIQEVEQMEMLLASMKTRLLSLKDNLRSTP